MSGKTRRQKLLFGATTVAICGALTLGMTNEAPLILYPITQSLPPGLYIRTFEPPKVGMIAAFRVPEAAKRYKVSIGEDVHDDFLFMKPMIAGPGDLVCCGQRGSLSLNGVRFAQAAEQNLQNQRLPIWQGCQRLGQRSFFTFSEHFQSIDSRHYGPISRAEIVGSYRPTGSRSEEHHHEKTDRLRKRRTGQKKQRAQLIDDFPSSLRLPRH